MIVDHTANQRNGSEVSKIWQHGRERRRVDDGIMDRYWRSGKDDFPTLFQYALDTLSCPAMSTDSSEIANGLLWFPSEDAFSLCGSSCKHTFNRVQQLHSSTPAKMLDKLGLGKNDFRKADNFAEINGAILFGNSSDLDAGKLELLSPPEVHRRATATTAELV